MSQLIAELAALLGVSEAELAGQPETAALILGLNPDAPNTDDPAVRSPLEVLAERWPGRQAIPKPLTAEALRAGLHDGIWWLKADLTVDFAWQASNATLIFLNNAILSTKAKWGKVKLTDCVLRNAMFYFFNQVERYQKNDWLFSFYHVDNCPVRFERCQITSNRGSVVIVRQGGRLEVVDCDFTTRNGLAIRTRFTELAVTKSRFTDCGGSNCICGAIVVEFSNTFDMKITDCRFERCIGKYAGAVYCDNLYGIHNCEFIACESRKFSDQRFANIAVFSFDNGRNPSIAGCLFEQSSLYVGRSSDGYKRTIARDCQFRDGNFIYYENSNHDLTRNCTFKNGQVIEAEL
jgi:hypothetical protein